MKLGQTRKQAALEPRRGLAHGRQPALSVAAAGQKVALPGTSCAKVDARVLWAPCVLCVAHCFIPGCGRPHTGL